MGILIKGVFKACTLERFLIKPLYVQRTRINRTTTIHIICLIRVTRLLLVGGDFQLNPKSREIDTEIRGPLV